MDPAGNLIVGFHDRREDQDELALLAEFEAYYGEPLTLRPILVRWATVVECRIYGWEEGSFIRCTTRAKNPMPMWQIEVPATSEENGDA